MKKGIIILIIIAMLAILAGCKVEETLDRAEDRIEGVLEGGKSESEVALSKEQAEEIALKDAGMTRDQVRNLHSSYDFDDGVPQYDVEFYAGDLEYDYEIHADSGKILSSEQEPTRD